MTATAEQQSSEFPSVLPRAGAAGGVLAAQGLGIGVRVATLDARAPQVDVDVPATAPALTRVRVAATVGEPGATVAWDFGDGGAASGAEAHHVYAAPGTYAVRATATDVNGNTATVTRQIVVTAPPAPPSPPGPAGPAAPAAPAPGGPVQQPVVKRAATLKMTRATRKGARVTVGGTIAASATGRVTVRIARKVGRRTVSVAGVATVRRGRWSVTLLVPRALRSRTSRATASYAGTAALLPATASRTVTVAKAPKRKARAKRP